MEYKKLIFVDSDVNHNKFYEMRSNDNGTFTVTWGRVGSTGQSATFPMSDWDKKLKEKTKKGYKDVTEHVADTVAVSPSSNNIISQISDPEVRDLIAKLKKYSKETISANYNIEIKAVTEKAVNTAQGLIDEIFAMIKKDSDIVKINRLLVDLFTVIPRKIKKVKDNLIQFQLDNDTIIDHWKGEIAKEQALLDVMRAEVDIAKQHTTNTSTGKMVNELEELGLEVTPADKDEIKMLKALMTDSSRRYVKAFKVINKRTQAGFDGFVKTKDATHSKTMLLFHGSRAENWLSIIKGGLVLRPTNAVVTGKMFGQGIYFAKEADKSLGYIDGGRWNNSSARHAWLAVYDVHIGKPWYTEHSTGSNFDLKSLKSKGDFDCCWAKKGSQLRRDEIIVYNQNQCTIQYLIEVTS